jgi:pimeloyl-ACP methyl ester carboxylesterase
MKCIGRPAQLVSTATVLLLSLVFSDARPSTTGDHEFSLSSYARPGTLVKLPGGGRLNLRCTGNGSPTVLLTAGAGDQSLTWRGMQSRLPQTFRTCAWDRPGFGFSDPTTEPLDVMHLTNDLEAALKEAKIEPPYVLVGHSLGSFETLMFAFRHPGDVAGIVLVDPAGPYQADRLKKAAPATYAVVDGLQTSQTEQLHRCIGEREKKSPVDKDCVSPPDKDYPRDLNQALSRIERNVAAQKDLLSLLDNMFSNRDSLQLKQAWHTLNDTPMIVLTAGGFPPIPWTEEAKAQLPALQAEWSNMHDDMAHLSTRGSNRVVPGATHYIHQDRPEVVLDAINEIVRAGHST